MSDVSAGNARIGDANEIARLRAENARLRSENARLNDDLNAHKRLLWSQPEIVTKNAIEDFKERRCVWTHLARRATELAGRFRKSSGTLPRFESMTAMLWHSVSTAADLNLSHNPEVADAEKETLRQAYADQHLFLDALNNLAEPVKRRILEAVEKEASHPLSREVDAAILACYDELMEVRYDEQSKPIKAGRIAPLEEPEFNSVTMAEAQRAIADRLPGRTPKAIENIVTRGRNAISEARATGSDGKRTRADAKATAFYFAYHHARSQLRQESGDALFRVRRLLSRFK
jgi:hypothetical protein